ncbi:hypothetical protein A2483_00275 [Candidatus Peregrinibacteria bacterium RIFOXYC2_FULL_33_13]|nr:MAG: RNA polymerase sigma factor [Candidatus Peregrinibacteria bacterium GW2011_GWA2_33_10]KKP38349.1 MAG: RNA polymerase sigma factor [Candidatus Peregrinibacteria bacterium GW2011_GWC2_33_13]OGJ48831.1 MAG: hypothetical protein A2229_05525 [Candidatus Peregrinibacteria bacterium RIFOXYA2_FULL_33_7]OGJ53554.1 MAG: hypothetical protein A2483_00275 [Candidatus Peregrinibacteria bacterium RIFOXYC2_FULL_33_13]
MPSSNVIPTFETFETQKNLNNIGQIVKKLLILLSSKEKYIIEKRFALKNKRETLQQIGNHFQITRERVRQIEESALNKLNRHAKHTDLTVINKLAVLIVKKNGGLIEEDNLISTIINITKNESDPSIKSYIKLCLTLEESLTKYFNSQYKKPYWKQITISENIIDALCQKLVETLENSENTREKESLVNEVYEKMDEKLKNETNMEMLNSLLYVDKRILHINMSQIGLENWRHINPKTIKDKAIYILNEKKEPLHFMEVAKYIKEKNFDEKYINYQAVHNELIRNEQFVLIGRGIYALKKWGFEKGTVKEVISNLLRKHKTLKRDEIVNYVLKVRKIKKLTVVLNLKDQKLFKRVGRNNYQLVE